MFGKIRLSALLVAAALLPTPSQACYLPPPSLVAHHRQLVADSETIVLARVVGKEADVNGGRELAQFETVEALRGEVTERFTLPNGRTSIAALDHPEDFDQHKDSIFWDKAVTRQWKESDCGMRLPGPGAIYISQTLRFLAPVKIGDKVEASVEVVELNAERQRAGLSCKCMVGDTKVLEGEAVVKVPRREEG